MKWKCDTCKHQVYYTENSYTDIVCQEGEWSGADGIDDDYKKNNVDPWKDCTKYESGA